jgi:signal transduction histidine kinase
LRSSSTRREIGLKWKIALWYAALLVVALSITSGILVWRFGAIVYGQVEHRADVNLNEILAAVSSTSSPLGVQGGGGSPLQALLNSDNLAYWSSPETWIEIDTPSGAPLSKTTNLGGERIAPAHVDAQHTTAFREIEVHGQPAIVEDRWVRLGSSDVVIQVAQSLTIVSRALDEARRTVIIVLVVAVVAVILLSILLASQAINPINELSRAMHEIGYERLDRRLRWPRRDEIGALAESFDDLLSRLAAAFARERRFISDVSHELKTPLTSINANAQMLLRWGDRDERIRRESLETIARESASLGEMVNGMLTLARADRGDAIPKEPVSLVDEARTVVREAQPRAREKHLSLGFLPESDSAIVMADPHLVRQMIGNLVDNAIKFTQSGAVEVRAGTENGHAWVEVRDSGPGIAQAELERVFERFYRGERSRTRSVPGTGLGLAIVRSIAQAHGGNVVACRGPSGGSIFRLSIPLLTPLS